MMRTMIEEFPWLSALWQYQRRSAYNDLKLYDDQHAFLYDSSSFEDVPSAIFSSFFHDHKHYERELMRLAWHLELRFDPYYPFLCHEIKDVGRITLIGKQLLGCGPHLFIRKPRCKEDDLVDLEDPLSHLSTFKKHFTTCPWLICGPSGVGKTTLLLQMLHQHYAQQPVVFMDRYQEGLSSHPHKLWTFLREQSRQVNDKGRVESRHLLEVAFKLGSDVLVFGEIRHAEVSSFFHGMFSGHSHVYGTFHAKSTQDLWTRLSLIDPLGAQHAQEHLGALFLKKNPHGVFSVSDLYLPARLE